MVLFTLGMVLVYLGYGAYTGTLVCECCLPSLALRTGAGEDGGPSPRAPCAGADVGPRSVRAWQIVV